MTTPIARRTLAAMLAAGAPTAARAQASPVADAFTAWMARSNVSSGTLALALDGRLVLVQGFGGRDATARAPIWSLSKFVTGLAVARLVAQGKVALDTPLSHAMPRRLARHGATRSPLAALTLADLLSQRSGLPTTPGGEAVPGLREQMRFRPPRGIGTEQLAPALLAITPVRPRGEAFEYSNANFLLAGLAVEELAGEPYAAFTAREVLARLGLRRPALDETWGLLGATGGWSLSAPDYLAVMLRGLQGTMIIPPEVRRWMEDPAGKALTQGGAVFYSLGMNGRAVQGGQNRWHSGSWRYRAEAWSVNESAGTYAVHFADRSAWFASYAPHPGDPAVVELDRAIGAARRTEGTVGRPDRFGEFVDPPRG